MSDSALPGWTPVSAETHETQCRELEGLVRGLSHQARVLDLGAGDGRLAVPLAAFGCAVTAVDNDPRACAALRDAGIDTVLWEFTSADDPPEPLGGSAFDLVLCAGNTFCLLHVPDDALRLMRRVRGWLGDCGVFAIDDIVSETWRDVAEGYWQSGVSESGDQQLIWAPGDNVIAIREHEDVDEEDWAIGDRDTRMRLWTRGELTLLARATGMSGPRTSVLGSLILFS